MGFQRAFRSIQNLINFSEKNLKIRAAVYLVTGFILFSNGQNAQARCGPFLKTVLQSLFSKPELKTQGEFVFVRGFGNIHKDTYALLKSLKLIESGELKSLPFHHYKATYFSQSSLFQKLLSELRSEYSISEIQQGTPIRAFRDWYFLIQNLDQIISRSDFRKDMESLSQQLGVQFDEALSLIFKENALTPKKLMSLEHALTQETTRIGLRGYEGFKVVLPLFNYNTLSSFNRWEVDLFVQKYRLDFNEFVGRWSARFPSISFTEIQALWPHVMMASKILRENRQFRISPYEFLKRVHAVDATLAGTLYRFGVLKNTAFPLNKDDIPSQIQHVRGEVRGWKKYFAGFKKFNESKQDREFLNPHLTEDVISNIKTDTLVNSLAELTFTIRNIYTGVHSFETLSLSIRNLFSDVLGDIYYNVMAPDKASEIVQASIKNSRELNVIESFAERLNNVDNLNRADQEKLLVEFWESLNPRRQKLTAEQIQQELLRDQYWIDKLAHTEGQGVFYQILTLAETAIPRTVLLFRDLKGNSTMKDFLWTLAIKSAHEAILFGVVGAVLGGSFEAARVALVYDDLSEEEFLEAVIRGIVIGAVYSMVWSAPRYVLLYDFNPQRLGRILQRRGISPEDPRYEILRAMMHKRSGQFNAILDAFPFPFLSAEFTMPGK